ncbi:fimbrial protein [Serratia marcescens]|uniref:fimbrial protein n=1 Tax=Serratia marcescens TaxID=615 RepID=UPI0039899A49
MKKMMINTLFLLGSVTFSQSSLAAGDVDMVFRGTLITPPQCTINDGNRIDVDFGDRLGINKVDGVNYRQPVNYQVSCDNNNSTGFSLMLSLSGTPTDFDADALQTSKAGLGVRMYQNNKPFTPNTELVITQNNPPALEVVPVKKMGAVLDKGSFEAWATLKAEYQ